jgi:hypothetical protein
MKKRTKKLSLSRETIRALADPPLQDAAGGSGSDKRSFCDACLSVASQCLSFCPAQC